MYWINKLASFAKFEIQTYFMVNTCKKYAPPASNITLWEYLKTVREIAADTRDLIQKEMPSQAITVSHHFARKLCDYCIGIRKKPLLIEMAKV